HLRLTLNLGSERVMVWGDAVRLQQVLWNVLKNAVKFTPAEGAIAVQTELVPNENRLLLSITDTGIGMTRDELERIFEAFSQGDHADGATAHRFGGLGLGLAISRMLIELHGGSIRAASPGRGQGSTFTIELPLAVGQAPAAAPSTLEPPMPPAAPSKPAVLSAPGASQRGSVLVVEDHVSTSRALAHLLQRRGFEVVTVDSVAAARQVTHERSFGFIISDIGLPDGTGYALMAELRQNFPSLRGVALSGYGTEQDIMRSREAGFEDHLTKPINVEALDSAIARLASTAKSSPGNSLNER
ncbi:MAG TPA: ATP-binding protein, partial [Candidatus Synoicihabitans sp.]|nr:ATP-binding protein [Candidatus Synoicihabitans sp.]